MFSIATLFLSFGLVAGFPSGGNRIVRDSTHHVVELPRVPPATQATVMQIDARTIAILKLRHGAPSKVASYPRNVDEHEGYTPALEERLEMVGPVVPHQEKHPLPAEPHNL